MRFDNSSRLELAANTSFSDDSVATGSLLFRQPRQAVIPVKTIATPSDLADTSFI